jgi:biopolymer transport protein ExbD
VEFAARRPRRPSENIVPLINVVFLLLIFFMLTGSLRAPAPLEIELPSDAEPSAPGAVPEGVPVLMLAATGELALDGRIVSPDEVSSLLATQAATRPSIALHADARAPARIVLPLLERLERAGFEQVDLVTDRIAPRDP